MPWPRPAAPVTTHRVCQETSPGGDHQCGLDGEHTGAHRCPCSHDWWRS